MVFGALLPGLFRERGAAQILGAFLRRPRGVRELKTKEIRHTNLVVVSDQGIPPLSGGNFKYFLEFSPPKNWGFHDPI